MTFSRSDRPYGSFPGPGKPAPAPEVPPIVPPLPLRVRIWRRVAAPLALAAMLVLSWQLVDAATMGDPSRLAIGSPAFVIGHPFGLTSSLSAGVVSGLDRSMTAPGLAKPLTGLIQFDAAVNPGNSGGPLVDANGEVVGIVTGLVNPAGQRVFSGVGFAITIDQAAGALGLPPD